MTLPNIGRATVDQLRTAYEEGYAATHVHMQVIGLCNATEVIGAITYPVIQLSTLRVAHGNVTNYLLAGFKIAGIRPDTPFHQNEQAKYAADTDFFRYMEYSTIGGGMRLIHDSTAGSLFLSCHYSSPAVLRATAGDTDNHALLALLTAFSTTHMLMKRHSDGTTFKWLNNEKLTDKDREERREKLALKSKQSEAFRSWLSNKNAGQVKTDVADLYGLMI